MVQDLLAARVSFSIETTLAGHSHLAMIEQARAYGYQINFVYVGTGDVEINLARIRGRVARGGHDIPEADVRRRFARSIEHAEFVASIAEYAIILDNSGAEMIPIIDRTEDKVQSFRVVPPWAEGIAVALRRYHRGAL
jgi:predicted ABC-type ATPase